MTRVPPFRRRSLLRPLSRSAAVLALAGLGFSLVADSATSALPPVEIAKAVAADPLPAPSATPQAAAPVLPASRTPLSTRSAEPATDKSRQLIVALKDDSSDAAQLQAQPKYAGLQSVADLPAANAQVLSVPAGADRNAVLAELNADPAVEYALPNRHYLPATNDPLFKRQWGLHSAASDIDVDFPEANTRQAGDRSVVVGVIDTGIDISHPDLRDAIYTNVAELNGVKGKDDDGNGYKDDVHGWDFAHGDATVFDDKWADSHGTHVAGTIAAAANNAHGVTGVAPGVTILPLKFIGKNGGWTDDAIEAIAYAKKMGVKVINASWGGYGPDGALKRAVAQSGAVFVAAAGNDGANIDREPFYPAGLDLPNVISVAAADSRGRIPEWSNYGKKNADLAAPGVDILSTVPGGYRSEEGTSMAAPFVSGAAALVSSSPEYLTGSWSPVAVVQRLRFTVTPMPAGRGLTSTGGMLNVSGAVGAAPASRFAATYTASGALVSWRNPKGATGVNVRLLSSGVPLGASSGVQAYAGTGTSVVLTGLATDKNYRVAIYASDELGDRPPLVVVLQGTKLLRSGSKHRLRARLVEAGTGRGLAARPIVLGDLRTGRVVCHALTAADGWAECGYRTGDFRWTFGGFGTSLRATMSVRTEG